MSVNLNLQEYSLNVINTNSSNTNINFIEWLVGLTEGDGTFTIGTQQRPQGTYYYCIFKVSQSAYNLKVLEFIHNTLKCGGIYPKDPLNHNYYYRVVGKEQLLRVIVPIFKLYPMHTIKYRRFELFLEALTLTNPYDERFAKLKVGKKPKVFFLDDFIKDKIGH